MAVDFSATFQRLGEGTSLPVTRRGAGSFVRGRYRLAQQVTDLVPVVVEDAHAYNVAINEGEFSFVSGVDATGQEIVDGLRELINEDPVPVTADSTGGKLRLTSDDEEGFSVDLPDEEEWAVNQVTPAGISSVPLPAGTWVVQPITGADIKILPEGRRIDARKKLWSLVELQLEPHPDTVHYRGEDLVVMALTDWSAHAGYYEYALVKAEA